MGTICFQQILRHTATGKRDWIFSIPSSGNTFRPSPGDKGCTKSIKCFPYGSMEGESVRKYILPISIFVQK